MKCEVMLTDMVEDICAVLDMVDIPLIGDRVIMWDFNIDFIVKHRTLKFYRGSYGVMELGAVELWGEHQCKPDQEAINKFFEENTISKSRQKPPVIKET